MATLSIRFRNTQGDIGPFPFHESVLVQNVRERVFAEWPKEGPLAHEPPTSAADVRLILSGKFVEVGKSLKDYKRDMGELKPDSIVTMHVVVRPSQAGAKQQGSATTADKGTQKGCCVVS